MRSLSGSTRSQRSRRSFDRSIDACCKIRILNKSLATECLLLGLAACGARVERGRAPFYRAGRQRRGTIPPRVCAARGSYARMSDSEGGDEGHNAILKQQLRMIDDFPQNKQALLGGEDLPALVPQHRHLAPQPLDLRRLQA